MAAALTLPALAGAAVPKPPPRYWGAWIGPQLTGEEAPWDMAATHGFEARIGRGLSLLEFSAPFAKCETSDCSFYTFPTTEMTKIRNHGAIPLFSWSSGSSGGNPEDFQLADIRSGRYDSHIRDFARAARDWGYPFFLRFNWEMNGSWFPWGASTNGNQVWEFKPAWRHVHRIFTEVGATNVSWVWCPYLSETSLRPFYPGGRYVDWTCLDGYNWGLESPPQVPWVSFRELFGPTYRQITDQIAPNKPMLLGEIASAGSPAAKAAWIRGMFASLRRGFRQVRGLVWFNKVDSEVDWPLETSPLVSRAFGRGLRRGYKENVFSHLNQSPIPPPRR